MKYHNITHDDMLNGDGLRVVLWLSGCEHHCPGCQNPMTWDYKSGLDFDVRARKEIYKELKKNYVAGITFSGGDPLYANNKGKVFALCKDIKQKFPTKTIWIYTGYRWEEIIKNKATYVTMSYVDVLVDGRFEKDKADINYHWAGSTNQRVIDVKKSLASGEVVLYEELKK